MGLLALELSDAGIMVAGRDYDGLLQIDGADKESPGFAIIGEDRLLVGRAAESKAHLYPLQVNNRFWDQLDTEPLKQSNIQAQNHAEIAFAHLSRVWDNIQAKGDELVIAAPAFLDRTQLGLIVGMAEELHIPLKGIVALAVAVASEPCPDHILLHLDMHLHRFEMTFLEQGEGLRLADTVTIEGKGLYHLYTEWVESIADEFVRTTRFDPLHQATSEQELYDRLPDILDALEHSPAVMFGMKAGHENYRISLSRDLFLQKSESQFLETRRLIGAMQQCHGKPHQPVTLQLTHRVGRLPGCKEMLANMEDARVIPMKPGTGAFGALDLWDRISDQRHGVAVSFFNSRPWQKHEPRSMASKDALQPTHLLYRNLAYPITEQPFLIGRGGSQDGVNLHLEGESADVSRKHCSVRLYSGKVELTDHSTHGTFVDDDRISGTAILKLGQIIRVGNPGEKIQLIACVGDYET